MPITRIGTAARQDRGGPVLYGQPDGTWMPAPIPGAGGLNDRGMGRIAGEIEAEESRRYEGGLASLVDAYDTTRNALSKEIDTDLLFSKAADAIGARSRSSVEMLRRSLGARGMSPNSGAAQGMLSRIAFEGQNAVVGAKLEGEIEKKRQRDVAAAQTFAAALGLANYRNAPVSGVRFDAAQNLFEGDIAMAGLEAQRDSNRSANRTNTLSALVGGAASFGGALAGLI